MSRAVVTTDASNRGRGVVCEGMPVSGRLVYLGGPEGCVFSYPDRPSSWVLSEICVQRHDVPIHGDAVRASTGTTYFNEICRCDPFRTLTRLRASGICIFNYLDEWLVLAHSEDVLNSHKHALLLHLESLGLCANKQKSVLCPSQSIMYLGDLEESASELGAHMRFDVRSECIQIGPSRGTEGISEAHGSDGGGRDGMSPRATVYASPPDMAESTGAEEGVEIGPCPRCGHSPVLERAVTMVEP